MMSNAHMNLLKKNWSQQDVSANKYHRKNLHKKKEVSGQDCNSLKDNESSRRKDDPNSNFAW